MKKNGNKEIAQDAPDVISIEYGAKQIIKEGLASLPSESTMLVIVNTKNYEDAVSSLSWILIEDMKLPGVYITANKPFKKMVEKFSKDKINPGPVFFIDCVTRAVSEDKKDSVRAFSSPVVGEIHDTLRDVMEDKKRTGFIVLDSLSTLFIYNDAKAVEKFIHELLGRVYGWHTRGIFVTIDSQETRDIVEALSPFFDKVIKLVK